MAKKNEAAASMARQRWKKTNRKDRVAFMKYVRAGGKPKAKEMGPEAGEPK